MTSVGVNQALRGTFGNLPGGEAVESITLTNASGMKVTLISYGAAIQSVIVPDRSGHLADITLGHATLEDYLRWPQYAGATVGRFANRIARGCFTLDDRAYQVPTNDGANSLHGGDVGFDRLNWTVVDIPGSQNPSVQFELLSPDGDQGYPGNLSVTACYTLSEDNRLSVEYTATTDAPTIVNLSNHAYWNLAGEGAGTAMDHQLQIFADYFLPVGIALIPTGERRAVQNTSFDFREPALIDKNIRDADDDQICYGRGFDHNWIVADDVADGLRPLARLDHNASGRTMLLSSNQPGLQFYSGNFFDGSTYGKAGKLYRMGDAIALEPQLFPDTPNQPVFGSARLNPGQTYRNHIEWHFATIA